MKRTKILVQYIVLLLFVFHQFKAIAQTSKKYTQEILFTNENDFYLLNYKDGYYTNGFFIQYSKAFQKNEKKVIQRFSLGQKMFTVGNRRAVWAWLEPFDRPYCGYLFARFTNDKFINASTLLSTYAELGVTGDLSLARQLQEWYHKKLQLFNYPYWEKQIPNEIGLNVGIKYATTLNLNKNKNSIFKIVPVANANAGTLFIDANVGAYFCLGAFEENENSVLFNAAIVKHNKAPKHKQELFVYFYPQIIFQGYNTTVQGNIFKKETNPEVFIADVKTLMYQQTVGIAFAKKRWTTKLEIIFQTKEATTQLRNHNYAGLHFAYRY